MIVFSGLGQKIHSNRNLTYFSQLDINTSRNERLLIFTFRPKQCNSKNTFWSCNVIGSHQKQRCQAYAAIDADGFLVGCDRECNLCILCICCSDADPSCMQPVVKQISECAAWILITLHGVWVSSQDAREESQGQSDRQTDSLNDCLPVRHQIKRTSQLA